MTSIDFCSELNLVFATLTGISFEEYENRDDAALTAGSRSDIHIQGVATIERKDEKWIVRDASYNRPTFGARVLTTHCPRRALRAVVGMFLDSYDRSW